MLPIRCFAEQEPAYQECHQEIEAQEQQDRPRDSWMENRF